MIAAHWLSAGCVLLAFAAGLAHDAFEAEAARALLLAVHRQAGLAALLLLALRLAVRVTLPAPGPTSGTPPSAAMRWAASASHALLYLLLLALPLLGWALSDARGQHPLLMGLLPLPTLTGTNPDTADLLEDRHRWAAWTLAALLALHVAAALWHHWVRRDGVLRAMWPRRWPTAARRPNRSSQPLQDTP